jgi:hypothetical protein
MFFVGQVVALWGRITAKSGLKWFNLELVM